MTPPVIDETGNRHGRLTVIKRIKNNKYGQAKWLCRCDCGKKTTILGVSLRGSTKGCGCLHKLPSGEASFNILIRSMKNGAYKRNLEWFLTKDQVRFLSKQNCYYCGIEPRQLIGSEAHNGFYIYNGLDRVVNNKGYTIENVVSCCGRCNRAKDTMTQDEFSIWISQIYNHSVGKEK